MKSKKTKTAVKSVTAARMVKKAPPPVKKAAPVQKTVKAAKGEPEDTGVGVGDAIRQHLRDVASDLPDTNTQANKDARMKLAKEKAAKAVSELPMTPEDQLVLKTTQLPEGTRVMRYHDSHSWLSCLMWITYVEEEMKVPGKKTEKVRRADAIHTIMVGNSGQLEHEKMKPTNALYFAEIQGGYPLVPAIHHFRKHANELGATAKVRELLGLSKDAPVKMVTVVERDEGGVAIGHKQVPKPPKGGNSNKPAPNAELDELYERAARLLGQKEKELRTKYAHLNNGLQAMNLRNRLRNKGHNV